MKDKKCFKCGLKCLLCQDANTCYKCDKGYILNEQDKCDCIKGKFLKYNY